MSLFNVYYLIKKPRPGQFEATGWERQYLGEVEGDDAEDALDNANQLAGGEVGHKLHVEPVTDR